MLGYLMGNKQSEKEIRKAVQSGNFAVDTTKEELRKMYPNMAQWRLDRLGIEKLKPETQEELRSALKKDDKDIRNLRARNLRGGKEFIDADGKPNTVWMRNEKIDGRWVAFPTLFYDEDSDNWYSMERDEQVHQAYEHAMDRNELFEFGDDSTAASNFAHGDWKPTIEEKFINSTED